MYIFDFFKKQDKTEVKANLISASELKEKINENNNLLIIDVSEPFEYSRRRIETAINIPLSNLQKTIDSGSLKIAPDAEIIVYCAHGIRSMYALKILAGYNFQNVFSLSGGIAAW